ncbi:hypothetical protein HOY80DRAFT_1140707 [Tuber brumale]|nr:hypothetical protein HOY80DRAFT_1140707 [Tuber brumale]
MACTTLRRPPIKRDRTPLHLPSFSHSSTTLSSSHLLSSSFAQLLPALSQKKLTLHSLLSFKMIFSGSIFIALIGAIAAATEVPSSTLPDQTGTRQSSKSVVMTNYLTTSGGSRFTSTPTVINHGKAETAIKYGEPIMPDQVPHPPYTNSSLTLTPTGSRSSPGNPKNVSKTMSINGTFTRFPIAPIVTGNATATKPTGTATPSNGTNRTTSGIPPRTSTSLGATIAPYGVAVLAMMIGFVAMGF